MTKPDFRNIQEIDFQIKENDKKIDDYISLVNRTIAEEFRLKKENEALKDLKKQLVLKRFDIK